MKGKFEQIKIAGIQTVVPQRVEENIEYEELVGSRRLRKQIRITGVEKRHLAERGHRASELCMEAAQLLLGKIGWHPKTVDYLIFVTQTPDFKFPSTAFYIQKELGLSTDCVVFDVNLGCSGYAAGLQILASLLSNNGKRALLLAGDAEYRSEAQKQREDYIEHVCDDILFGHAGSATALEKKENFPMYYSQNADGQGYDVIIRTDEYTQMDGNAVFNFAMNEVAESVISFRKEFSIPENEIDYYVFHQAQALILDSLCNICEIDGEKSLSCLREYGNTSSSSIPLALCANLEKVKKKPFARVYLCGFGIGLSWASIYTELETSLIFPVEISKWKQTTEGNDDTDEYRE